MKYFFPSDSFLSWCALLRRSTGPYWQNVKFVYVASLEIWRTYCFGHEESAKCQNDAGKYHHDPKVEAPPESGFRCESPDYWSDNYSKVNLKVHPGSMRNIPGPRKVAVEYRDMARPRSLGTHMSDIVPPALVSASNGWISMICNTNR